MPLPRSIVQGSHRDLDLALVRGAWPADLAGEIYLSAPGPADTGASVLFANGVIARLSLRPDTHGAQGGAFAFRARPMATPSARLWSRRPELFERRPPGNLISPLGALNMANTAPMVWGDRLFVTWDGGRPVEIDPLTLNFLGEVGHRRHWGSLFPLPLLPMLISTAHPVIDDDRDCLWTVNLGIELGDEITWRPSVVRYDGQGPDVKAWPIEGAHMKGVMHSIGQTREWLILAESGNFKTDPIEMAGGPRTVITDLDSPLFLVRKEDLDGTPAGHAVPCREFRVAPPTGHYFGVTDDREGVRVLFEHMENLDLGHPLLADDQDVFGRSIEPGQVGMFNMAMSPTTLTEVVFSPESGEVVERARFSDPRLYTGSLSAMDFSPRGMARPTHHHLVYYGFRPGNMSRRVLDLYRGRVDPASLPREEIPGALITHERGSLRAVARWDYGADELPTSPTFVPRAPAAEPGGRDGYVVVPVLADSGFRVEVFDAAHVAKGPVAVLATRETVPFLLHSAWMPEAKPARPLDRLRFRDELDAEVEAALDPELSTLAHEIANELDASLAPTPRRTSP